MLMIKQIKRVLLILGVVLSGSTTYAQIDADTDSLALVLPKPSNNATLIGIGGINLYDTYLSPLEYKGKSIHLINERMKQIGWFGGRFTRQQTINIEFALADNPAKNASEYWLLLSYNWGGHYNFIRTGNFRFSAGAIWNLSGGVLYNERNSNNPASARLYSNINLSAIAFYKWRDLTFRWQLDTPVVGVLFSPNYGQSYYEISLGNSVGVANFSSLHNQRALRNYITVDIPVSKVSLRVGYLGSHYQTKVNNLQTHTYSNSFVVGFVSESINLSGNKLKKAKPIKSSYYLD